MITELIDDKRYFYDSCEINPYFLRAFQISTMQISDTISAEAKKYENDVLIRVNENKIDCKSIIELLSGANEIIKSSKIEILVRGTDEKAIETSGKIKEIFGSSKIYRDNFGRENGTKK